MIGLDLPSCRPSGKVFCWEGGNFFNGLKQVFVVPHRLLRSEIRVDPHAGG